MLPRSIGWLLPALIIPGSISAAPLTAQEYRSLPLLISARSQTIAKMRLSSIIEQVDQLLKQHTLFSAQAQDSQKFQDCQGRLSCIALRLRPDFKRAPEPNEKPSYLLLISTLTGKSGETLVVTNLVDTNIVLSLYKKADRSQPDWRNQAELLIGERAVLARPPPQRISGPQAMNRYLERLLDQLQPIFTAHGQWEPFGSIKLTAPRSTNVIVDGRSLGTTQAKNTEILGLLPGPRTLELKHPKFQAYNGEVQISSGQSLSLTPKLQLAGGASLTRSVVMWSGVGATAVGAAVLIAGAVQISQIHKITCITGEASMLASCEENRRFPEVNYPRNSRLGNQESVELTPVFLIPLGYSLMATGLTWALGTWLFGQETDVPWLQLLTGLVVGGASYALSTALNPSSIWAP